MSELSSGMPAAEVVYDKTPKGIEEVQTRKYNLSQKLRTTLIVVDGKKNVQTIFNLFGAVGESLVELEKQGFIEKKTAATGLAALSQEEKQRNTQMAKNFMMNTVKDALGLTPAALTFADSVKQSGELEDLQKKFDPYVSLITSASGKKKAEAYRDELKKLLFPK
jgi:hypothetical protein